eukprot:TRINITY_DN2521_c0_g1_i3.p1 TRINITY_DN2521_c0_g1~~TRINITY_DN2521_c0_g1_i3.p1  ORF type:complete len:2222 (+),score=1099.16 TRINITY_DN2521_c0_g1_i3:119-6784(+)
MPAKAKDDRPPTGGSERGAAAPLDAPSGSAIAQQLSELKDPSAACLFTLKQYPEHAAVFDSLWNAFGSVKDATERALAAAGEGAEVGAGDGDGFSPDVSGTSLTEAEYVNALKVLYKVCHVNPTEKGAETAALRMWDSDVWPRGEVSLGCFMERLEACRRSWDSGSESVEQFAAACLPLVTEGKKEEAKWRTWATANRKLPSAASIREQVDVTDYALSGRELELRTRAKPSANRLCVISQPGAGAHRLGAAVAAELGALHVTAADCCAAEVVRAAAEAAAAPPPPPPPPPAATADGEPAEEEAAEPAPAEELSAGQRLLQHVKEGRAVPLELQAELIRQRLQTPEAHFRGYVLSDFPPLPQHRRGDGYSQWLSAAGVVGPPPTGVGLQPNAVVSILTPAAGDGDDGGEDEELRLLAKDVAATAAEEEAERQRQARVDEEDRKVEQKAARRAERDRKRAEAEAAGDPPPEEDGGEEEEEVDADGNPIDPAQALAKHREGMAAEAERRLAAEARRLVRRGQLEHFLTGSFVGEGEVEADEIADVVRLFTQYPAANLAKLYPQPPVERGALVNVHFTDSAADQTKVVLAAVPTLAPRASPQLFEPPKEDGGEPPADEDEEAREARLEELGQAKVQLAMAAGNTLDPRLGRTDPVCLHEHSVAVQGHPLHTAAYAGCVYYFTKDESLQRFVANPDRFLSAPPHLPNRPILVLRRQQDVLDKRAAVLVRHAEGHSGVPFRLRREDEEPVGEVPSGTRLMRLPTRGNRPVPKWERVLWGGKKGWVAAEHTVADGVEPLHGVDAEELLDKVVTRLRYTAIDFGEYAPLWRQFRDEQLRVRQERERLKKLEEERLRREEEERKAKERKAAKAAAKRKEGGEKGDDKKKKAKDKQKRKDEEEAPPEDEQKEAEVKEEAAVQPPTHEERMQAKVDAAIEAASKWPPLVVSGLDFQEADIDFLYEQRLLPETVVCIDWQPPPVPEDEEAGGDDDGDDPPEPDAADGDDPPDAEPDADAEEGEKPKGPFDRSDPAQYRGYIESLLARLQGGEGEEEPPEEADGAEGSKPAPLPKQTFSVHDVNCYGGDVNALVDELLQLVDPFAVRAAEPAEGDDDDEPEPEQEEGAAPIDPRTDTSAASAMKRASRYGAAKWCPVSLAAGLLIRGNPATRVDYLGQRWLFRSAAEQATFRRLPHKYIPSSPPQLPPPRLWVVGVKGSGKSMMSEQLSQAHGVPVVSLKEEELLRRAEEGAEGCEYVARARAIAKELKDFDAKQEANKQAKADRERRLEEKEARAAAGDDGDDDDDEADEDGALADWEPEEEEAREQRLRKQHARIFGALVQAEPLVSQGYILDGVPVGSEGDAELLDLLAAAGAVPEAVVMLAVGDQCFVRRRVAAELAKARAAHAQTVKELRARRVAKRQRERRRELQTWRTRNVADGEGGDEEEEEIEDDPEPPTEEAVREALTGEFSEQNERAEAMLEKCKEEKAVLTFKVQAEGPTDVVAALLESALAAHLARRSSLIATPYAETFERAKELVRLQRARLSSFAHCDPVRLADDRAERVCSYKLLHDKSRPASELAADDDKEVFSEPPPPAPEGAGDDEEGDGGDAAAAEEPDEEEEIGEEELQEKMEEEAKRVAALELRKALRCAVFNGYVYCFTCDEHLARFIDHPWGHLVQPQPPLRGISADPSRCFSTRQGPAGHSYVRTRIGHEPPIVAVVLSNSAAPPPGVKQRTLAEQLAANIGAVYVSKRKLVQEALRHSTALSDHVQRHIVEGSQMPDALIAKLVCARLMRADVQLQGCVLDGLPDTAAQAQAIDSLIQSPGATTAGPLGCIHKVLLHASPGLGLEKWQEEVGGYFERAYHNVEVLTLSEEEEAAQGPFSQLVAAVSAAVQNQSRRQELVRRRLEGRPAGIFDTTQAESSLPRRRSQYGTYCPAEWVDSRLLCNTSDTDAEHSFAAEFCGRVYHFSSEERLLSFCQEPERYDDTDGKYKLPKDLPKRMPLDEATAVKDRLANTADWSEPDLCDWQYMGFCPVTLYYTRDDLGLCEEKVPIAVTGKPQFAAEYQGKKFKMADLECCEQFMQRPWVYVDGARLPRKLPIPRHFLSMPGKVPMDKYMEHTLHEAVVHAMLAVAEARPKFPGLSAKMSAVKYMAVHMKANNPNNTVLATRKFRENFRDFGEACGLFDFFLRGDSKGGSEDYDRKAALWDSLRGSASGQQHADPERYIRLNLDS